MTAWADCTTGATKSIRVDAKAILDLIWLQARESRRQRARIENLAAESQCPGSGKRPSMQINKCRRKPEIGADSLRDVIDRERADFVDATNLPFDLVVERFECPGSGESGPSFLEFTLS